MLAFPPCATLTDMQLIQIGEVRQKTVLELVQEMAMRQLAEIEELKSAAKNRMPEHRARRSQQRCNPSTAIQ